MSYTSIPNQPIRFDTSDLSHLNQGVYDTSLTVLDTDTSYFQVLLGVETSLITGDDTDFDTDTGNWDDTAAAWTIDTGDARAEATGNGDLTYTLSLTQYEYYEVQFDVSFNGGSLDVDLGGNVIRFWDNEAKNGFNTIDSTNVSASGTMTGYILVCSVGDQKLTFTSSGSPTLITIDNVTVKEMVHPTLLIKDCNGNTDYTLSWTSSSCSTGIDDATSQRPINTLSEVDSKIQYRFHERYLTVVLSWADLALDEDLYYITLDSTDSNEIKVASTLSGYKKIEWGINESTDYTGDLIQGFDYGVTSGFMMRIKAELTQPRWSKDRELYQKSDGQNVLAYSKTNRLAKLRTELMSPEDHAALAVALEHPRLEIDDIKYISDEDEYAPNYNNVSNLSYVSIELKRETEDLDTVC